MYFKNRKVAGQLLALKLEKYKDKNAVVLGVPHGGVVLAAIVAKTLNAPLDLILAKKITPPFDPEFAIGAMSENGQLVVRKDQQVNANEDWFLERLEKAQDEIISQRNFYSKIIKPISIKGKIVIIIDDGTATGLTMEAAIKEVKRRHPKKIIVGLTIAPADTAKRLKEMVDELVVLEIPNIFLGSVAAYYYEFPQVSDEQVLEILGRFNS